MLLRRIIRHVRRQEWTAIAIDFLIVVVGVFIGIQAANWNAAREDETRARSYLERIHSDLEADLANYANRIRFWRTVSNYGLAGLGYAENSRLSDRTHWDIVLAYFQSSQVAEFWTRRTTYDELKSAGKLHLISNLDLRNALALYYAESGNPALTERPAYREHVREIIPIDVQMYIWTKCYASDELGNQALRACASPVGESRAAAIADSIRGDDKLMAELRYWMSTMQVASKIGHDRAKHARLVRASVEKEIGGRRN